MKRLKQNRLYIERIPAIEWGEKQEKVFLAVHGNMSHKADTVIQILAEEPTQKGYQVLSFDLPEHGDRKEDSTLCKVQNCVKDLAAILQYGKAHWTEISLFGCSMGAYFSLVAYREEALQQALFLSPVVSMERIIENMMMWFQVTPEKLKEQQEIPTPIGQTLYWDYYCYVKEHPITKWDCPTSILYGEKDDLSELAYVSRFVENFGAGLEVVQQGEHYFHTPEQLASYQRWLQESIR